MCIKSRRGQAGQALLEYIILIFISLVLVLGFVYQFNTAFKTYLNTYFVGEGSYLYCLIADGLLPGDTSEDGSCSPPKFDIKTGKALDPTTAAGGAGAAAAKNAAAAAASHNSAGAGRAAEGSSSRSVPLNSRDGRAFANADGASAAGASGKSGAGADKKESTGSDGFSSSAVAGARGEDARSKTRGSSRYVPYNSSTDEGGDDKKPKTIPTVERDMKTGREIAAEKAKRKKLIEEDAENFSIGNILKYIIIFVIFFSIVFFFGTAMVAVAQGNRKRRG